MAYKVDYKATVANDLKRLPAQTQANILGQLEAKLSEKTGAGQPLKGKFKGLFKLRVGEYRALYAKTKEGVIVLRIRQRGRAYKWP